MKGLTNVSLTNIKDLSLASSTNQSNSGWGDTKSDLHGLCMVSFCSKLKKNVIRLAPSLNTLLSFLSTSKHLPQQGKLQLLQAFCVLLQ